MFLDGRCDRLALRRERAFTQAGDTLPIIAARFGLQVEEILSQQSLPVEGLLDAGQLLLLPPRIIIRRRLVRRRRYCCFADAGSLFHCFRDGRSCGRPCRTLRNLWTAGPAWSKYSRNDK